MALVDEVKTVMAKSLKIPTEQLTDSSTLADLGVNSLEVIELIFDLEESFDVDTSVSHGKTVPALGDDVMSMSVGDIANAVKQYVDTKAA